MRIKTRINRNELLFFLLGFPFLNPTYLAQLDYIGDIMDVFRVCSFIVVIILILSSKKALSNVACIITASQVFIAANTIYHGGAVHRSLTDAFGIISVVFFYEYAIKENVTSFVKSQLLCFEIVIYINFLTILLFPEGLYKSESDWTLFTSNLNWFLGYYNTYTRYYLPAIVFSVLNVYLGGSRLRKYILLVAICISAILVWSGGVIVAVFFTCLCMVLGKKHFKLFNYANYWLIQLVALILIMFFQIQNIFQLILKSVLGKGDSIIGRIKLWEKVISYIRNSLIIGYGLETGVVRELKTGMNWASHAHNLILEILYQGGLVYFILFVVLIDLCGKKMMKNKGSYVVVIISAAFAGWSVHSIVEPYIAPFLMGLFIIGYYSDRIINAGAISNIYEYVTTKLREVEKGT